MATRRGEQATRVVRYRPPGVTPLEIWDFSIGDGIVSDYVESPVFGEVLHEMLAKLHAGCGKTRSGGQVPAWCRGFDSVVLTGGGAREALPGKVSPSPPFSVVCLGPDPFIGDLGGYRILGDASPSGAVVDVGQTQIKVSLANQRFAYPRDFEALPVRRDDHSGIGNRVTVESQRRHLEQFIGGSLHDACRLTGRSPSSLVVALPCEVDDDGVPGSSSYLGTEGNVDLLSKAFHYADLGDVTTIVLNDAELAAVSVAVSPRIIVGERLLVITIGLGVGAALLGTQIWKK